LLTLARITLSEDRSQAPSALTHTPVASASREREIPPRA
jgi:hypothetical protein